MAGKGSDGGTHKAKKPRPQKKGAKPGSGDPGPDDTGIIIMDEEIEIDRDRVNEERRAYLEEARSQEASD
ncbi:conserved hypothetical protein [Nitrosopumilaceae archaeon]|nr:hypothetical protein [Nitrosopumilus sp.]CAI9831298.1 conserved hypothetical protein [Nitrosopumilaceae archaeon]MDA7944325.1 hypothetical protein [Nitrosopumilus sp.]MDA7954077.1 hypothetical protein [Nitrosopumilus sp.]MDA7973005.1 hypothetical protein [Nitrosopumilus sp.]